MTGIFLVRGINLSLTSLGLLKISLLLGLAGSLIGIAGAYSFPLYSISGMLLGLSGALLPPSNQSIRFFLKRRRSKISHSNLLTTVLLTAVLFGALFLKRLRLTGVIGVRALFSGCFSSNQELSCFIKRARRRISRSFTKRINSVCYLFCVITFIKKWSLINECGGI